MKSMTGYGRGYASREGREATIEVKSVNSRFLDLNIRMPGRISVLEESLRRLVSAHCDRGKVDLSVSYRNNREDRTDVQCDAALAGAYLSALRSLSRDLGVGYQPGLMDIAGFHGVLTTTEREEDLGAVEAPVSYTHLTQDKEKRRSAQRALLLYWREPAAARPKPLPPGLPTLWTALTCGLATSCASPLPIKRPGR